MKPAWRSAAAALAFFALLAVLHTWPLATGPGRMARNDTPDTVLNEWTLAWVAHEVAADPAHLFDANIFYPARRTLAFSEHLLPQALMVAPVLWLGGSPVLAYNLALLLGLTLTGWAWCLVVARWTSNWPAGVLAGSLAAFNAHTLTRLPHVQAQHLEFLPFALLALDRLLARPRTRHALSLAGWFALQALCSGYLLVFSAVSLVAAAAARPRDWLRPPGRRAAAFAALAAVVGILLLLPFLLPYWRVRQEYGLVRTIGDVSDYSARLTDYVATGARVHWAWSSRFFQGDAFFPGVLALVLAGTALATGRATRDARARSCLVIGAAAFVLSFGTRLPIYTWLYRLVPLFQGIRAPSRFGQIALLAIAVLAGYGLAWWLARIGGSRTRAAVAAAAILVVNAEALRAPLFFREFTGVPPVYRTLAAEPNAVVACFPFYAYGAEVGWNTRYMLGSTLNWKPMLNGYSGFMPSSFEQAARVLRGFPDETAIGYLRRAGVTHVIVDAAKTSGPRLAAVEATEALQPYATDGVVRIYTLK